jgi:hypothetical protein
MRLTKWNGNVFPSKQEGEKTCQDLNLIGQIFAPEQTSLTWKEGSFELENVGYKQLGDLTETIVPRCDSPVHETHFMRFNFEKKYRSVVFRSNEYQIVYKVLKSLGKMPFNEVNITINFEFLFKQNVRKKNFFLRIFDVFVYFCDKFCD